MIESDSFKVGDKQGSVSSCVEGRISDKFECLNSNCYFYHGEESHVSRADHRSSLLLSNTLDLMFQHSEGRLLQLHHACWSILEARPTHNPNRIHFQYLPYESEKSAHLVASVEQCSLLRPTTPKSRNAQPV